MYTSRMSYELDFDLIDREILERCSPLDILDDDDEIGTNQANEIFDSLLNAFGENGQGQVVKEEDLDLPFVEPIPFVSTTASIATQNYNLISNTEPSLHVPPFSAPIPTPFPSALPQLPLSSPSATNFMTSQLSHSSLDPQLATVDLSLLGISNQKKTICRPIDPKLSSEAKSKHRHWIRRRSRLTWKKRPRYVARSLNAKERTRVNGRFQIESGTTLHKRTYTTRWISIG